MELRTCPKCFRVLPESDFYRRDSRTGQLRFRSLCKLCNNLRRKAHRYLTNEVEILQQLKAQGGRCAICWIEISFSSKNKNATVHIDHNHRNKKLRGLLCGSCNSALGLFLDDVVTLENAIAYLRQYGR